MDYPQNLVCFNTFGAEKSWSLDTYLEHDGYQAWRKILNGEMDQEAVIEEGKASGQIGRASCRERG